MLVPNIPPRWTNHEWIESWTYVYMRPDNVPEGRVANGWKCTKCGLYAAPFAGLNKRDRDCDSRVVKQIMEES